MNSIYLPLLRDQLTRLKAAGAEYADVRFHDYDDSESLFFLQGELRNCEQSSTFGLGVRVLVDGAWGFASASNMNDLDSVFQKAFRSAKEAAKCCERPVELADRDVLENVRFKSPCQIDPFDVPLEEKIEFFKEVDAALQKGYVKQRYISYEAEHKHVHFLDSEGSYGARDIVDIFAGMRVVGIDEDGLSQERTYNLTLDPFGTRGWELMRDPKRFIEHAPRIVSELELVLQAPPCPKDVRSVILKPGIMFLQTHEVVGHALELDRILGYELSFAGGSFVTLDDFGNLRYGSDKMNVAADATLPNSPGSFGFDDDGVPCQNIVLIKDGILQSALTSRQTVTEANSKAGRFIFERSGGANSAMDFTRPPIERMTNINILPGTDGTLEDIVRTTEKGIIMDGDRSWSIGSNREQFHFACEIGWLVENGAITGIVRNPTYSSKTLPFWRSMSAVGDRSTCELVQVANCGKGLPSQIMRLGHCVPVCRFDNVQIGL
ncbi:TldD/PmbA family protein [bacterium]|nr:TldD/PmbA family protein [bacterium]